jgi:radical SAM protein with 4Fe4S-binding SPASM domain
MRLEWLRYGWKELTFVRSRKDLRILSAKAAYLLPRAAGITGRYARVPHSLQIEPTNDCNLSCVCCSRRRSTRARGYMDLELFCRIVDEASSIGVKLIRLYALGEPMLHPQIADMVAHIKRRGLYLRLVTNGTRFDAAQSEAILRSGVDSGDRIIFSVLGFSKEVHEKIQQGADHDQAVDNIRNFVALRQKHRRNGPIIETFFLNMPENDGEQRRFYEYWRPVVDHVRVEDTMSKQFAEFNQAGGDSRPIRRKTCVYLWDRLLVFWNGDVGTCVADPDGISHVGNLREQSIRDLWNSERLMSLREMHRQRRFAELPLCRHCDW